MPSPRALLALIRQPLPPALSSLGLAKARGVF